MYNLPNCIKLANSQLYTFRQVSLYLFSRAEHKQYCAWREGRWEIIECPITPHSQTMQRTQKLKDHGLLSNTETNERGAADSKTNSGEVILVDWAIFSDRACNSHLSHIVLIYSMSKVN